MESAVDIGVIEQDKENIAPLVSGRSAAALAKRFESQVSEEELEADRDRFESALAAADELDDPLQIWLEYLKWVHESFPEGSNVKSGLISLLERCTHTLRDLPQYKNDPRFLRVWLEYIQYSDAPREAFNFMMQKEIGKYLAGYYENYASWLEVNSRYTQANEVYELGLQSAAQPFARLQRRYDEFCNRRAQISADTAANEPHSPVFKQRTALASKTNEQFVPFVLPDNDQPEYALPKPKSKLQVFTDSEEAESAPKVRPNGWDSIGTLASRRKENKMEAQPWVGQTLPSDSQPSQHAPKLPVFRDGSAPTKERKPEKIAFDMDLAYPGDNQEYSPEEIRAKLMGIYDIDFDSSENINAERITPPTPTATLANFSLPEDEIVHRPASPTMTLHTRGAKDDIYNMFSAPLSPTQHGSHGENSSLHSSSDSESESDDDENLYNQNIQLGADLTSRIQDEFSQAKCESKFENLSISKDVILTKAEYNPFEPELQRSILEARRSQVMQLPTVFFINSHIREKVLKQKQFESQSGLSIRLNKCLGKGAYAPVYLGFTSEGEQVAVKIESPANIWEYYIMREIENRSNVDISSITKSIELSVYSDASVLVMKYHNQGTTMDLINTLYSQGQKLDESISMLLTLDLLRTVNLIHGCGIIHGDLKPDNCMVRLNGLVPECRFSRHSEDWKNYGVALIDFGRSIDLTAFNELVLFSANWKTDNQDCTEIREGLRWKYQMDYFGVAAIVHCLLFGSYIETNRNPRTNEVELKSPLKRYWSSDIWAPLFKQLLNSGDNQIDLNDTIENIESWLESNYEALRIALKRTLQFL
ncbi:hypothetical protein CANCADRAFT_28450 [Tortispora caseinolytica NRRL Y-17796]|uniref:Protein kinase domain-containing protein n=1 Tax=Tortispora caseinolytica NRRL Y-17796 TaxID=767744 RepID=A0A1E4TBE6_9ASCO|nr:hypothetical protein CANCADRAFT_28450 [Tortispora caseinolytica NRRL Y-17796]